MTDQHWQMLQQVIKGKVLNPLPVGFIIDSPGCQTGTVSAYSIISPVRIYGSGQI